VDAASEAGKGSLSRHVLAALARASGEAAFNVSRVIGHSRSTIVDTIYAHTVDSALAGISESVSKPVGLTVAPKPEPPKPAPPSRPPKLRLIDGGQCAPSANQRDVRKPIENAPDGRSKEGTSD
jgi:hypothetical protein